MWSIIVHGGAGKIDRASSAAHQDGCRRAVFAGSAVLSCGGPALDAVRAAVRVLEDDPVFNAGIGSALDARAVVMTDAAIMRGSDLAYGAAASVTGVLHPIDLATAIMEDGKHCMIVGPAALAFARTHGVERCDPRALETSISRAKYWGSDTVGAVALDAAGEIVAGTSTGGILGKAAGRVGDSPIAGAGTYARTDWGGISATGHGETMMRTVLAFHALIELRFAADPSAALRGFLDGATARTGGRGGLIAVLPDGRVAWARNTQAMGAAWASSTGSLASVF